MQRIYFVLTYSESLLYQATNHDKKGTYMYLVIDIYVSLLTKL